jgi:hypothetical protein
MTFRLRIVIAYQEVFHISDFEFELTNSFRSIFFHWISEYALSIELIFHGLFYESHLLDNIVDPYLTFFQIVHQSIGYSLFSGEAMRF